MATEIVIPMTVSVLPLRTFQRFIRPQLSPPARVGGLFGKTLVTAPGEKGVDGFRMSHSDIIRKCVLRYPSYENDDLIVIYRVLSPETELFYPGRPKRPRGQEDPNFVPGPYAGGDPHNARQYVAYDFAFDPGDGVFAAVQVPRRGRVGGTRATGAVTAKDISTRLADPWGGAAFYHGSAMRTTDIAAEWEASDEAGREQYRSAIVARLSSKRPEVAAAAAELCWLVSPPMTEAKRLVAELCARWRRGWRAVGLMWLEASTARYVTASLGRAVAELQVDDEEALQFLQNEELLWQLARLDVDRALAVAADVVRRGTPARGAESLESELEGFFGVVGTRCGPDMLVRAAESLVRSAGKADLVASAATVGVGRARGASSAGPEDEELFRTALRRLETMRAQARPGRGTIRGTPY